MSGFSADQKRALREVFSTTAPELSAVLGIDYSRAEAFLRDIAALVGNNAGGQLGRLQYVLALKPDQTGTTALSAGTIARNVMANFPIISFDTEMRFVSATAGRPTVSESSKRTSADKTYEIVLNGPYAYHCVDGKVVGECNYAAPGEMLIPGPNWSRPFSDIIKILNDHKVARLNSEKGLHYWKDKPHRILRAKPEPTEELFRHDLFWWLNQYVIDRIKIIADPVGQGQNKTDILVITADGPFVIEVKWLGKNESGTTYHGKDVNSGLIQVGLYLKNDPELAWGYLVVYDGRSRLLSERDRKHDPNCKHAYCHDPILIFLESDSPSVVAKALAKNA